MAVVEGERTDVAPPEPSRHDEKAIAFFGTWVAGGLYVDGWAHLHDKPETFFSPWHLILYSGFVSAVMYFLFRDLVQKRRSQETDRLASAGLVVFIAGAVGDGAWHQLFGIEVDIEALLSPTHLMLLTGGVLMLSIGARVAAKRDDGREVSFGRFFPTLASLTLVTAVTMFFTQYFSAHRPVALRTVPGEDFWDVYTIGTVFVTNALLLGPTLFAVRRWNTPMGTFAILYGTIALGQQGMAEFNAPLHVPAAVLAGFAADLLAARLRPSLERHNAALVFALLVPFVMWSLWVGAIELMRGVHWAAELWTGTIFLAMLEGLGLALLAFPRREKPAPVATR